MDKELIIPIGRPSSRGQRKGGSAMRRYFLIEKLNNPLGYILMALLSVGIAVGVGLYGMKFGILTMVGLIAIPAVYALVRYPLVGMIIYMVMAYILIYIIKLGVDFPIGTLMDGMEVLFLVGLFVQQKKRKDWSMFKGPITTVMFVWIGYNVIEFFNPTADSQMAWVYTVRTIALITIMYFVFLYNIRTIQVVRFMLKLWLGLAFIVALYAYKQQYLGFTKFEWAYLTSDPEIENLLFIGGVWRKFSIFSDPVVFAYTMVVSTLLCISLLTGPVSTRNKWILRFLIVAFLDAMLFSGTRGAYVLLPAGMLLYGILKFNKKILLIGVVSAAVFLVLVYIPTSNNTLYRFQTAFKPSDDASFNLRKSNQKKIQPFIQSHPLGGGLGATGVWGLKFSPGSYLAHFPPDSGYVRVAVEMGWIGLFLICLLMFVVLKTGIDNYYKIKDPELKSYALAMVLIIFAFQVGNYPQEALVQFPSNVNFYLAIALINVLMRLDREKNELNAGK